MVVKGISALGAWQLRIGGIIVQLLCAHDACGTLNRPNLRYKFTFICILKIGKEPIISKGDFSFLS